MQSSFVYTEIDETHCSKNAGWRSFNNATFLLNVAHAETFDKMWREAAEYLG
jgi:hypothetical protein